MLRSPNQAVEPTGASPSRFHAMRDSRVTGFGGYPALAPVPHLARSAEEAFAPAN